MPDRDDAVTMHTLDKRLSLLEQTVERLTEELKAINQSLSRLVWTIGGALGVAVVNWVIRGGLGA